jgi:hypothetical protein
MKDESSAPTARKMTDVSLSIFRSKFKDLRIQMIDNIADPGMISKPEKTPNFGPIQ